ncbi:MAG: hypothetical protein O6829_06665 [Alphaproteobacteria bacterium]|nr:hypothetical protein [Alphaproteobacteria bacterium]MCZ6607076.1 hypothetical protein [Alphaproteobacteria bacterium]
MKDLFKRLFDGRVALLFFAMLVLMGASPVSGGEPQREVLFQVADNHSKEKVKVPERITPWPPRKIDLPYDLPPKPPKDCVPGCIQWGFDDNDNFVCKRERTCP